MPQLRQSLKILALSSLDLKAAMSAELESNPFLEESQPPSPSKSTESSLLSPRSKDYKTPDLEFRASLLTKKPSLQDVLLRQLGMFAESGEALLIGQEIIGNIDENGYLKAGIDEIAALLGLSAEKVESALKLIQQFEPAGVGARTVSECLTIQLDLAGDKDPLVRKIAESHLEDVARKNYSRIAGCLKEPLEAIEPLVKRILRLDPKPGRNYSTDEAQTVVPDIVIANKNENIEIFINNEDLSLLSINKTYSDMLKSKEINPQTKEFLKDKYRQAVDLLRAVSRRQKTLRRIVESVAEIQEVALKSGDLSALKPITFKDVALALRLNESTVCRAVMNKYVELPHYGVVALKDFFTSHIHNQDGQSVSSSHAKRLIKELIEREDRKHPLSDQDISHILLKENNLKVSRRTVTKYREEFGVLSSVYRRVKD